MKLLTNWFWTIFFISFFAISSALVAEYLYELEPCSMCLKQRHPYYFIILIFLFFIFFNKISRMYFYISVQLASIYGLFYSIWHVGIEQKILQGPISCSQTLNLDKSIEGLKEQIMTKSVLSCEDVIWSFFGISAATINTFLLLFIFIINAIYIKTYYASKKL